MSSLNHDLLLKSGCFWMAALYEWWKTLNEQERLVVLSYLEQDNAPMPWSQKK